MDWHHQDRLRPQTRQGLVRPHSHCRTWSRGMLHISVFPFLFVISSSQHGLLNCPRHTGWGIPCSRQGHPPRDIKSLGQHRGELITGDLALLLGRRFPCNYVPFFKKWVISAQFSMLTSLGAFEGICMLAPASGIGTWCLQPPLCRWPEAENAPKLGSSGNPQSSVFPKGCFQECQSAGNNFCVLLPCFVRSIDPLTTSEMVETWPFPWIFNIRALTLQTCLPLHTLED